MSQIVTRKVRFSYPQVFSPKAAADGAEPKYSLTVLIPKEDTETYKAIMNAMKETYEEGKNSTFKGLEPDWKNWKNSEIELPIHDGDGRKPKGGAYGDECKGHWVLSCASKRKPAVVDGKRQPVADETMVYPGCYGRVAINFYGYKVSGAGIAAGLNGVQTYNYGEGIGGSFSVDAFDDGFEDAGEDDDLL